MVLRQRKPYIRARVLEKADRARGRGRLKKAIAGYRQVLQADPKDAAVHGKIAPLLARTGQPSEALASFEAAARIHLGAGFSDRALSIVVQAARFFPERASFWEAASRLHLRRGRRVDAATVLTKGGTRVGAAAPAEGVRLLRLALAVDTWNVGTRLALARLLRRQQRRAEARALLEELAPRLSGQDLRRVRRALFWIAPTPAAGWRWLRAALRGR
jgi:cytochrome c-type biogenesis protein CcmH/NrfG